MQSKRLPLLYWLNASSDLRPTVLLRLEMGTSFATARCCPACYERIMGREQMEEALKKAE